MIDGDHSRWGNWNWWQPFWRAAVNRKSGIISVVTRQQFVSGAHSRVPAHPAVTVTRSVISWKPRWQMLPARGGAVRLATGAGLNINTTTGMRLLISSLSVSSEQNLQATPVIKEKVGMIFGSDIADMKNIIIHTHGRYKSDIQI